MAKMATPIINNFFGENNFMADTSALAHRTLETELESRLNSAETTLDYKLEGLQFHEGGRYAVR